MEEISETSLIFELAMEDHLNLGLMVDSKLGMANFWRSDNYRNIPRKRTSIPPWRSFRCHEIESCSYRHCFEGLVDRWWKALCWLGTWPFQGSRHSSCWTQLDLLAFYTLCHIRCTARSRHSNAGNRGACYPNLSGWESLLCWASWIRYMQRASVTAHKNWDLPCRDHSYHLLWAFISEQESKARWTSSLGDIP